MTGETVTSLLLKLLAVGALVLLNGFFVAAELAVVKIRDTQLDTLVLKGHRRARIARQLIRNLDSAISATTALESTPPLKKAPSGTSLMSLSLTASRSFSSSASHASSSESSSFG